MSALAEFAASGVSFAAKDGRLESAWKAARDLLLTSFRGSPADRPMLIEGDDYRGCWLESTGSIGAETLSRFCPELAESTLLSFALLARGDGLLPYKLTEAGPAYRQVQMVTPLARSVWIHAELNGPRPEFLVAMYRAMADNDAWLARHRDTRGSGCVEAFCAFDTGHDLSPRFWGLPDTCHREDPARCDPDYPLLPYLAPDLTANVHCQRLYLARIARALGREAEATDWEEKAGRSLRSLMRECYDPVDACFYDRDAAGRLVRLRSDVLLRVLACGVGDGRLVARALHRHLLDSRRFLARFPPTSVAMDDPRFDPSSARNSWAGPTNLLSLLRAPAAFEPSGRYVELGFYQRPCLQALSGFSRWAQCMDPWSGEEGFGSGYTPAMLCLLDTVERRMGILPLPGGALRFSSAEPGDYAYSRRVDGILFELEKEGEEARVLAGGAEILSFPAGFFLFTDRAGRPSKAVGALPRRTAGRLRHGGREASLEAGPNQTIAIGGDRPRALDRGGFILPR